MKIRRAIVTFGVLLLALVGAWAASSFERESARTETGITDAEMEWRERIAEIGGRAAYAEFLSEAEKTAVEEQHGLAHVFGGALYRTEGLPSMSVCDSSFSYGCFHEFLGRAIAERSLSVVPELNDACASAASESPLSCQHGIGHGIQGYFGYDRRALERALDECKDLPWSDPIGGCYSGVFMEYNLQTLLGTEAKTRVPGRDPDDIYEPCDSLPDEYKVACVYWQVQWWHAALFAGASDPQAFAKMGGYCHAMAGEDGRLVRACFEGLGNFTVVAAGFDPKRTAALCDASSSESTDRLFCRSIAANSLYSGGAGLEGNGAAVCYGLPRESYDFCIAYAHNKANILDVLPVPQDI